MHETNENNVMSINSTTLIWQVDTHGASSGHLVNFKTCDESCNISFHTEDSVCVCLVC